MAAPVALSNAHSRWDAIDVARGVAIAAMVVYHFSWDLSFLQLVEARIVQIPAWQWFARSIAGSFLFLSGVGLTFGHAAGFRPRAFLLRLVKVGGAALAVTVVTLVAFPRSYIFFGILHCIAVTGVLALPFLRAPAAVTAAAAAFSFAAPWLFSSPALDHDLLDWLGLGRTDPITNDYVPLFPWFGPVLLGLLAGRAMMRREVSPLARWRSTGAVSRVLRSAGRQSLPIYLIHQPLLLAILYGVLVIAGPNPAAESAPFVRQCAAECAASGLEAADCRARCGCVVEGLRARGLWPRVVRDETTPDDAPRITELAEQCFGTPEPPR
jgi:uncharacterized membrane protein